MNDTHRPDLASWVESANRPGTDFPIQNLPFGVFRRRRSDGMPGVGIAIGDEVLDVSAALEEGAFGIDTLARTAAEACDAPWLNGLMALGPEYASALRARVSELLRA